MYIHQYKKGGILKFSVNKACRAEGGDGTIILTMNFKVLGGRRWWGIPEAVKGENWAGRSLSECHELRRRRGFATTPFKTKKQDLSAG
jgi:hypothetical protein